MPLIDFASVEKVLTEEKKKVGVRKGLESKGLMLGGPEIVRTLPLAAKAAPGRTCARLSAPAPGWPGPRQRLPPVGQPCRCSEPGAFGSRAAPSKHWAPGLLLTVHAAECRC